MSKHQKQKRADMPHASTIRAYWAYRLLALGKITDTEQVLDSIGPRSCVYQCFNCGDAKPLDRAHIQPLALGGDNEPGNLHMLCRVCHTTSERFTGEAYWRWFLATQWRCFMDPWHSRHAFIAAGYRDMAQAAQWLSDTFSEDAEGLRAAADRIAREIAAHADVTRASGATLSQTAGVMRAKTLGKYTGRKPSIRRDDVVEMLRAGESPTAISRHLAISRPSVYRIAVEAGLR